VEASLVQEGHGVIQEAAVKSLDNLHSQIKSSQVLQSSLCGVTMAALKCKVGCPAEYGGRCTMAMSHQENASRSNNSKKGHGLS